MNVNGTNIAIKVQFVLEASQERNALVNHIVSYFIFRIDRQTAFGRGKQAELAEVPSDRPRPETRRSWFEKYHDDVVSVSIMDDSLGHHCQYSRSLSQVI